MLQTELLHGERSTDQDIYVVRGLRMALLGRPALTALGLVVRPTQVHAVSPDLEQEVKAAFPHLFIGIGKLEGEYHIQLKPDSQPFALTTPRRVALPLLGKVKTELGRMLEEGVIARVEEPTEWCAGMVVIPKAHDAVRICVDLSPLNESVRRELHVLPSVEHTLGQLSDAKIFTKLDAQSGFWQIVLAEASQKLTTFITPFGRYCFKRLPFGISSAPEHFQRRMSQLLDGLEGVVCQMDDILVYAATQEEHDKRLYAVLQRLESAGLTLNTQKCEFAKQEVKFLGQIIDGNGVRADPDKVAAVTGMPAPTNVSEVRRFMGLVNHLGKYIPHLADKSRPIRELLNKNSAWSWGPQQGQAFSDIKRDLTTPPGLALYDATADTKVSADASSYGLGAVLLQRKDTADWRPIAYASRALSDTERRYAQVEKEALATTWACEQFRDFLIGLTFQVDTDHKALLALLGSKRLDEMSPRIQRFRMRLMHFSFSIAHVPGKDLATADTLSRAPMPQTHPQTRQADEQSIESFVNAVLSSLPITEKRLQQLRQD